jgi:hypothetical protein
MENKLQKQMTSRHIMMLALGGAQDYSKAAERRSELLVLP